MPDDFQYGAPDYLDAIQRQLWPSVKNTANQFSADQDQQLADLQQTAPIQGGLMAPQQPQQQQDQGFLGGLGSLFSNIRNSPITQGIGNTLSQAGNAFFSPGGQALIGGLGTMAMVPKGYPRMNAAIAKAKSTVNTFLAALKSPKPGQTSFSVKMEFQGFMFVQVWIGP